MGFIRKPCRATHGPGPVAERLRGDLARSQSLVQIQVGPPKPSKLGCAAGPMSALSCALRRRFGAPRSSIAWDYGISLRPPRRLFGRGRGRRQAALETTPFFVPEPTLSCRYAMPKRTDI